MSQAIVCPCCRAEITLHVTARQTSPVDWKNVDWSQSNRVIAERTGRYVKYVELMRRRTAISSVRPMAKHDWSRVDWTQRTRTIAKKLGTTDNYVSKMRKLLAPETRKRK